MPGDSAKHGSPSIRSSYNFNAASSTTSFNPAFEARVNASMAEQNDQSNWSDTKGKAPMRPSSPAEADDSEFKEKMAAKQKSDLPPRFSTIFGPPMASPPAPVPVFESYPQDSRRRSGIYIATPVFWALFVVFMIMSAALFAYTVIGLFTNIPSRLVGGGGVPVLDIPRQPVINISPNFDIGQHGEKETVTVTVTTTYSLSSSSSSSSTSSSSTSSSANSTEAAGMIATQIAGILHSQATSSSTSSTSKSSVPPVTVTINPTPTRPTVSSTVLLTVDASGHTLPPQSTVTSTTVIDESQAAAATSSLKASIASALAENSKVLSVAAAAGVSTSSSSEDQTSAPITEAPSTLLTSTTSAPTSPTTTSTSAEATQTHEKETCPGLPGRSPPCPK